MAKTRSRGPVSPKTPLSEKTKKVKSKAAVEASPSARKVKSGRVTKTPEKKKSTEAKKTPLTPVTDKVATGALEQLVKFVGEQDKPAKLELFDDEDDKSTYLQITTKKFYSNKPNFKPKVIKLSNTPITQDQFEDFKICLIVRDDLITSEAQIEQIESENIKHLSKIYTLKDIKTEFKPFEKRRQLYDDYEMFLVDDALMNSLPSLLGKVFYDNGNSKIPLPIRITSTGNPKQLSLTTLKNQVEKSLNSTFFLPPVGVNVLVKIGAINKHEISKLAENIKDVVQSFDISSLRSIMVKTTSSPALPLFYSEKIYEESDVIENVKKDKKSKEKKLSAFERGLLEIGTPEDVTKIIGKKLGQKLK